MTGPSSGIGRLCAPGAAPRILASGGKLVQGRTQDLHIEDSSRVRVRDQDTFALHLTGRPSDEGAMFARKVQCKDILSRTRRLEEFYIFQLDINCDPPYFISYFIADSSKLSG